MTQSLIEDLARYLAKNEGNSEDGWYAKGYLTDTLKWHYTEKNKLGELIEKTYMAETCGRKLRLLEEQGRIARKDDNNSCQYKFIPVTLRSKYVPYSYRKDKGILWKL